MGAMSGSCGMSNVHLINMIVCTPYHPYNNLYHYMLYHIMFSMSTLIFNLLLSNTLRGPLILKFLCNNTLRGPLILFFVE